MNMVCPVIWFPKKMMHQYISFSPFCWILLPYKINGTANSPPVIDRTVEGEFQLLQVRNSIICWNLNRPVIQLAVLDIGFICIYLSVLVWLSSGVQVLFFFLLYCFVFTWFLFWFLFSHLIIFMYSYRVTITITCLLLKFISIH